MLLMSSDDIGGSLLRPQSEVLWADAIPAPAA